MGTMVATDVTGGVDVSVTLVNAVYLASTGGHVTIAWNLDTPTAATSISPTTPTYTAVTSQSPPGCSAGCGSFTNGLQGTWRGTSNDFAGPVSFFLAGITTSDFENNTEGFMGAIDALGPGTSGGLVKSPALGRFRGSPNPRPGR